MVNEPSGTRCDHCRKLVKIPVHFDGYKNSVFCGKHRPSTLIKHGWIFVLTPVSSEASSH